MLFFIFSNFIGLLVILCVIYAICTMIITILKIEIIYLQTQAHIVFWQLLFKDQIAE